MSDDTMAYAARYPCGCIGAAVVDSTNSQRRKDIAKDLSEWIRDGAQIERATVGEIRPQLGDCPHKPKWGVLRTTPLPST